MIQSVATQSDSTSTASQRAKRSLLLTLLVLVLAAGVIAITISANARNQMLVASNTSASNDTPSQSTPAPVTQTNPAGNASAALVRINQSDVNQYSSQSERDTWWAATCSAASMTEVINAYGHHYKISDILKIESRIGAITPQSGLLHPEGIDQTAGRFGFTTTTLNHPSLNQIVAIANKGQPVIVNFPPDLWPGGHFLVVRGGTSSTVQLADSSILNHGNGLQEVSRDYFSKYWRGFAKVLSPSKYVITRKPTITANQINTWLEKYHSPAAGTGQALYDLGLQFGIDPRYALATFMHESNLGTSGEATATHSVGNLRCIAGADCIDQDRGGYAAFPTWEAGYKAFYTLIAGSLYVGDGRIIPELIIPRYAPNSDGNSENSYITDLKHWMDTF